jgi:hypothetical protein
MRQSKFKRGYKPTNDRLEEMMEVHFDEYRKDGDIYYAKFGAAEAKLWIENKKLYVETKTNTNVPGDVAAMTVRTYNIFLEDLTGYTAKQRQKMMKKEVED